MSGIALRDVQLGSLRAALRRVDPVLTPDDILHDGDPLRRRAHLDRLVDQVTVNETFFLRHGGELEDIAWADMVVAPPPPGASHGSGAPRAPRARSPTRWPCRRPRRWTRRARRSTSSARTSRGPRSAARDVGLRSALDTSRRPIAPEALVHRGGGRAAHRRRPAGGRALRAPQPRARPGPSGGRDAVRPDRLPQRPLLLRRAHAGGRDGRAARGAHARRAARAGHGGPARHAAGRDDGRADRPLAAAGPNASRAPRGPPAQRTPAPADTPLRAQCHPPAARRTRRSRPACTS